MTPQQVLQRTTHMAQAMREMAGKSVAVGLPKESGSSKIYESGLTVIEVGARHEFGDGVPSRSFLRTPFKVRAEEIRAAIDRQAMNVIEGGPVDQALGMIGVKAANISKGAFTSRGYGQWEDLDPATKTSKGSSQVLVDTGTLRGSITWVIKDE